MSVNLLLDGVDLLVMMFFLMAGEQIYFSVQSTQWW